MRYAVRSDGIIADSVINTAAAVPVIQYHLVLSLAPSAQAAIITTNTTVSKAPDMESNMVTGLRIEIIQTSNASSIKF
jgi:hypothetical protein